MNISYLNALFYKMTYQLDPNLALQDLLNGDVSSDNSKFKYQLSRVLSEIIIVGDINLLEHCLSQVVPNSCALSGSGDQDADKLLFDAFHEIFIKKVGIAWNMKQHLCRKFIQTKFEKASVSESFKDKLKSLDYFNIIKKDVCEKLKELFQLFNKSERRNRFIFICFYLASKINILKKLFRKVTKINQLKENMRNRAFPWEEIQFILSIYVYSHQNIEKDGVGLYLCVLTEHKLINHLNSFMKHLESFDTTNEADMNTNVTQKYDEMPKNVLDCLNNDTVVQNENSSSTIPPGSTDSLPGNQVSNDRPCNCTENPAKAQVYSDNTFNEHKYPGLDQDFWLIKNIYSLKIINEHIDVILGIDNSNDDETEINYLALEWCLLIIGEFSKCTTESPNLSEDVKHLLSLLTVNNVQDYVKTIRNDLSHVTAIKFGQSQFHSRILKQTFSLIKHDFMKIKDSLNFLLNKEKYKAVKCFAKTIVCCDTLEKMHLNYPEYVFDAIIVGISKLAEEFNTVSLVHIEKILKTLQETTNKSDNEAELILVNNLIELLDRMSFNEDLKPIKNEQLLICLVLHLRFFQIVKEKYEHVNNYKLFVEYVDIIVSNMNIQSFTNRTEFESFERNVYNLLKITQNPDIKEAASQLLYLVCLDLKNVTGIKQFKHSLKDSNVSEDSFSAFKNEVDAVISYIRGKLVTESDILLFDTKVNDEVKKYHEIKLKKSALSGNCIKDNKIKMSTVSKGDKCTLVDNVQVSREQAKSKQKLKKKYTGNKRCNYEKLIKAFMSEENYSVQSKAKLICDFLNFENVKEEEKSKLSAESLFEIVENGYLSIFEDKFRMLRKICSHLKNRSRKRSELIFAVKIILLEIFEIAHKLGGVDTRLALLSLRPDVLIHCGKSFRNFLAHQDIVYKLFSFDTDLILLLIAEEISVKVPEWIAQQNYLTCNEDSYFDLTVENMYFGKQYIDLFILQEHMFEAVVQDDLVSFEKYLELGADPRGNNCCRGNALQLAFDNNSVQCFKYLIDTCKKINLCRPEINTIHDCLILDVSTLSLFVKLIAMIYSFPSFQNVVQNQNAFKKVDALLGFLSEKFYCQGKLIKLVEEIHIFVYFQDFKIIHSFCEMGLPINDCVDLNGNTALHWAAGLGFTNMCQILLDFDFELNCANSNRKSPLDLAVEECQWETVEFLLNKKAARSNLIYEPLLLGIMMNDRACIDKMLKMEPFIRMYNCFNIFLFGYALCYSNEDTRCQLFGYLDNLSKSVVVDFFYTESNDLLDINLFKKLTYNFILRTACFIGRKDIVCLIFKKFSNNFVTLSKSIEYSENESLYLRNHLNSFHQLFKGESLIHCTCVGKEKKNVEIAKFLLENGCKVNEKNEKGLSALHIALLQGNAEMCRVLIDNGADIESFTPLGLKPIHISSLYGLTEVIQLLISKKAELSVLTRESLMTPIHLAACVGREQDLKILLDYNETLTSKGNKSIIDVTNLYGSTALHLTLLKGNLKAVKTMLHYKAELSTRSTDNLNVIHAATCGRNEDVLKLIIDILPEEKRKSLINSFTNVDDIDEFFKVSDESHESISFVRCGEKNIRVETPLFCAQSTRAVQLLLKAGADINLQNSFGNTALHNAIVQGWYDAALTLIERGCVMETVNNNGRTPLIEAISLGMVDVVISMIKKEVDLTYITPELLSAMLTAAGVGNVEITNILVNLPLTELKINESIDGVTPIMVSSFSGHERVTKLLIDKGAKIDRSIWENPLVYAIRNGHTQTAITLLNSFTFEDICNPKLPYLHCALANNNCVLVEALLSKGIKPDVMCENLSALHFATYLGHLESVKILVNCKINLETRTVGCLTALHLAVLGNWVEIIRLLVESGARINSYGGDYYTTPLSIAIQLREVNIIKFLIDHGARIKLLSHNCHIFEKFCSIDRDLVKLFFRKLLNDKANASADSKRMEGLAATNKLKGKQTFDLKLYRSFSLNDLSSDSVMSIPRNDNGTRLGEEYQRGYGSDLRKTVSFDNLHVINDTLLHRFALKGNTHLGNLLIANGADVNAATSCGMTPLHWAIKGGSYDFVELLLDHGAHLEILNDIKMSPLHLSLRERQYNIARLLIRNTIKSD